MAEVLLISDNYIKNITNISDNISGKLLNPAIMEAQECGLRQILGDNLIDKIKSLVANNTINDDANINYKNLLKKAQYYLAYEALSNIIVFTSVKIDNMGIVKATDENTESLNMSDMFSLKDFYQNKADYYCKLLQNFILSNRSLFPELSTNDCNQIKSNLYSSSSCGVFLGGARGKGIYGRLRNKYGD